jgi:hypothetical protein
VTGSTKGVTGTTIEGADGPSWHSTAICQYGMAVQPGFRPLVTTPGHSLGG